jgi:hypothetical protein
MATKKDQHKIPQLHLRNFVGHNPEGHIWTYQKEIGKTTSAVPQEVAFEKHFYSFRQDDGTQDTTVEDFLAKEGLNNSIMRAVLIARNLSMTRKT